MATMLLSADELVELTGKVRSDGQRRALEGMGIPYKVRPNGSLAVLRQLVEVLMGAGGATITRREPQLHL